MKMTRRQLITHGLGFTAVSALGLKSYQHLKPQDATVAVHYAGMQLGHQIRDHQQGKFPTNPNVIQANTVVIGSGAAALSALWQLKKNGHSQFLLFNGPEKNGNNADAQYQDLRFPTGAHYLAMPSPESEHMRELLADLGIYQNQAYRETDIVHAPVERLFHTKSWQSDLLPEHDADSERFFEYIHVLQQTHGHDNKRAFTIPIALSSQEKQFLNLDKITFEQWLKNNHYQSKSLIWYLNYCCLDDYGQGIQQVSAWAGLHYFAARSPENNSNNSLLTWPNGLAHISEQLRSWVGLESQTTLPGKLPEQYRFSIDGSALRIEEQDNHVELHMLQDNKIQIIHAQHVICAMPLYVAQHTVKNINRYGFQAALHLPTYAPWLIGNFVLNGFPKEQHSELAWDNVLYPSEALGFINSTHQNIHVAKPQKTVFTSYRALNHLPPADMRHWLKNTASEQALIDLASQDLEAIYGKEFRLRIEHIELTVRAHAMASPEAGYRNNNGLKALQNNNSRLLFAHSDLSGYSIFEEAAWWGIQAAQKILKKL